MDRESLTGSWCDAAQSGSLLTAKHDPNHLSTTFRSYRTVLSHRVSASLETFISSGAYEITKYDDAKYPNGVGYFEVTPKPGSAFSVVGSGVPSESVTPTGSLDRLVFVSGSKQGWHVYAESAAGISSLVASGRLYLSGSI